MCLKMAWTWKCTKLGSRRYVILCGSGHRTRLDRKRVCFWLCSHHQLMRDEFSVGTYQTFVNLYCSCDKIICAKMYRTYYHELFVGCLFALCGLGGPKFFLCIDPKQILFGLREFSVWNYSGSIHFIVPGMCDVEETAVLDPVGTEVISRKSDLSKMDIETNLWPNITWVGITKNKIREFSI
jgi:hypothetical protein